MRVCPECRRQYDDSVQFCPIEAAKLMIVGGPEEDPLVNQVVAGKYRVERKIGEGGMGKIYFAKHVTLGKRFALKTLHADFTRNSEALERFRREAITTAALEHPNILAMQDMDQTDDGTAYIVMEYLDGKELRDVLNDVHVLPLPRLVHIFSQVCRALAAAHDKGIVHRDLKPENVFLVEREGDADFVKVLDFGIARVRQAGSKLTQTGMVIGTPHYMSPEQAKGDPNLDHRSDLYTIGAMMYESLTGQLPVQADSPTGVLVKILTEELVPPRAINPNIPPELEAVVMRAMAKDPNQRYGSSRELMQALQQATGFLEGTGYMNAAISGGMYQAVPPTQRMGTPGARPPTSQMGTPGAQPAMMTPQGYPSGPTGMQPQPVGYASPPVPPGMMTPPGMGMGPGGPGPSGPTPMAWQQQPGTGPQPLAAQGGSKAPLYVVLTVLLLGGAAAALYFLVFAPSGDGGSSADAKVALVSAETGVVNAAADAGLLEDAAVEAEAEAVAEDSGTTVATAETGPDVGPEDAGTVAVVDAGPPDTGPVEPPKVAITFITDPDSAKVFWAKADGTEEELCSTPCQHEFPQGTTDINVVFRKSNYRDQPAKFTPNNHGFVNVDLERIRSGSRDAGAREAVSVQVQETPDAGPPPQQDTGRTGLDATVVPRRDVTVIVVPPREAGIRIEVGVGVQQVDAGGPRLRDSPFGH